MTGKTVVEPETVTFSFAMEEAETVMADIDLERLNAERRRTTTYPAADRSGYQTIRFSLAFF